MPSTMASAPTTPTRSRTIDEILERWQGPAYPELADVDAGRAETIGLAELRVRAVESPQRNVASPPA